MKAVILAGGFGTRLSEETSTIPKPMIEIGGRPLLWHLMSYFSNYEVSDFTVALGYKGEIIKNYFLQYPKLQSNLKIDFSTGRVISENSYIEKWKVDLVDTGLKSMTGGRLLRLKELLNETFIFTYGDGLSNIDLVDLIRYHRSHGKLATVSAVRPASRFGLMRLGGDGQVKAFSEKPDYKEDLVNGGFFILEPGVFDYIDGDHSIWEKEPCERLVEDGELMAYQHTGFWQCVDTLHELRVLRQMWDEGKAGWKIW